MSCAPVGAAIRRVIQADLAAEPWPDNLDVALSRERAAGFAFRPASTRIVLRPLNAEECNARSVAKGYLVDRVVNRRDLERILKAYR